MNTNTTTQEIRRQLNIHEYLSMQLLQDNGLATVNGYVATTPTEATEIYRDHFHKDDDDNTNTGESTSTKKTVVLMKAQVLSSGREAGRFVPNGFVGGIQTITSTTEAHDVARGMLGTEEDSKSQPQKLITEQAPEGVTVDKVWLVEQPASTEIVAERYISLVMDRNAQLPLVIGCPFGSSIVKNKDLTTTTTTKNQTRKQKNTTGRKSFADIVLSNPQFIFTEQIDIEDGLEIDQCERMVENITTLHPNSIAYSNFVEILHQLYHTIFKKYDCTQIEINPLIETKDGRILIGCAKINFDDGAISCRPHLAPLASMRDYQQEDPREAEAMKHGINYIGLQGTIGCMVNGAGLAMATMDLLKLKGGSPANFLDVGGGASLPQITKAFEILETDPNCKVILVNIFGGLMRCDVIAKGILTALAASAAASKEQQIRTPLIVRLQGTNYEEGKRIIEQYNISSNLNSNNARIILANDLDDAAEKAIQVASELSSSSSLSTATIDDKEDSVNKNNNSNSDDNDDDESCVIIDKQQRVAAAATTTTAIPKFDGFSI